MRRRRCAVGIAAAIAMAAMRSAAWAAAGPPPHDYVLHCAGCHGFDGSGSVRVPALAGIRAVVGRDGWREYLARVPGVAQAPLTDARLAALLNWVLARFADVEPRPSFAAAEVGRLRARPLRDPREARARLLAADPTAHGRR